MTRVLRCGALLFALALAIPTSAAEAQQTPPAAPGAPSSTPSGPSTALEWFAREPATLFDLGLMRLDTEMKRVARNEFGGDPSGDVPQAGASWRFQERRVRVYLSIFEPSPSRTDARCRDVFERAVSHLVSGGLGGSGQASYFLETLFVPAGRPWNRPTPDVGEKLINEVVFEVVLRPTERDAAAGDKRRVRCEGRLDAKGEQIRILQPS